AGRGSRGGGEGVLDQFPVDQFEGDGTFAVLGDDGAVGGEFPDPGLDGQGRGGGAGVVLGHVAEVVGVAAGEDVTQGVAVAAVVVLDHAEVAGVLGAPAVGRAAGAGQG